MAIASPSPSSSISGSLRYTRSKPSRFLPSSSSCFTIGSTSNRSPPRLTISSLHSSSKPIKLKSKSSTTEGPDYEFRHKTPIPRWHKGSFVYVTLPIDVLDTSGKIKWLRVMHNSLRALALQGVKGIVMEVWWGLVESDAPANYDWRGYLEIVTLARHYGLKVRAVMAFHELGSAGDSCWIPLPYWVRMAMTEEPDLAYTDKFGGRSSEYISLGCDVVPVLRGRTPIQAYSDFMRSFRDTFKEYLGVTITGVQVGMGPGGELRYPWCPSEKLVPSRRLHELGEFQCYDKYMAASLEACALDIGKPEWGKGGPLGTAGDKMQNPEETKFFKSDGTWNTEYGRFFLEWYSGMLLLHGERLCAAAENIFAGSGVSILGKLGSMYWHYDTESHPSELTAGYYNTSNRDGYLPIAQLFRRYGVILCCRCFELRDKDVKLREPLSSPEGLVRQIVLAVREAGLPLDAENSGKGLSPRDTEMVQQVVKMFKLYCEGVDQVFFSFNFVRLDETFFAPEKLPLFNEFVKQISPGGGRSGSTVPPPPPPRRRRPQAKLSSAGVEVEVGQLCSLLSASSPSAAAVNKVRAAAYY